MHWKKSQKLYTNKLIDPEMLVRSDSKEPLLAGKVGIFFGPWWCGYTVADATLAGAADWQCILYTIVRGWKLLHSYGRAYNTICSSKQSMQESGSCI